jgi:hypothetical protein
MTTIRDVLAVAGGLSKDDSKVDLSTGRVPAGAIDAPVPQIGTGTGISDLLAEADLSTPGYQWVHGAPLREFEPHADLDGVEFSSFDDSALDSGSDDWVGPYFIPGDHDGCTCDFMPMWAASDVGDRPVDQIDSGDADDDVEDVAASAAGR